MKILVVDDDTFTRTFLKRTVTQWGHDVVAVSDGLQALESLAERPVDLVITDWMMPNLDGMGLVREIRHEQSEDYIYIMLATSQPKEDGGLLKAFEAGVDDFITKPFSPEELQVRLRACERIIDLHRRLAAQLERSRRVNHAINDSNQTLRREVEQWARKATSGEAVDVNELFDQITAWFHNLDLASFGVEDDF